MRGVSGSKSWSNKEEAVERGGQSVIQAVLETNHAGSWGHSGVFSSLFFLLFFLTRALVQFCRSCTRNQASDLNKQTANKPRKERRSRGVKSEPNHFS